MICPTCKYDMGDSLMCPKCGFGAKEYEEARREAELNNAEEKPPFGLYLAFSLLLTVLCQIPGIVALTCTILMNSTYQAGDYITSLRHRRRAKIALSIGYALMVLFVLLWIFVFAALWPHTVWAK